VNDAVSVCRFKGVRDLDAKAEDLCERQRPAFDTGRQRLAFEQFEYEILGVLLSADVVQAADVRVIEGRDRFGLALEAGAESASPASSGARTFTATLRSSRL
jgi:hypothetical protein